MADPGRTAYIVRKYTLKLAASALRLHLRVNFFLS